MSEFSCEEYLSLINNVCHGHSRGSSGTYVMCFQLYMNHRICLEPGVPYGLRPGV